MREDLLTFFSPGKFNFDILDFPFFIYLCFEILNYSMSFVDIGIAEINYISKYLYQWISV